LSLWRTENNGSTSVKAHLQGREKETYFENRYEIIVSKITEICNMVEETGPTEKLEGNCTKLTFGDL
jgi:hypothetical protein